MAKAVKLSSGNWRVLLYVGKDVHGNRKYESYTAQTKAEAEWMAAQRKTELQKQGKGRTAKLSPTVGEAIDRYIDARRETASPKTIREYVRYRKLYFSDLMDVRLSHLTSNQLQQEINRESRRLSPKSVYNAWGLVRSALTEADPGKTYSVKLPAKEKKEMQIPTREELCRLLEAAEGTRLEIPLLIAATCGLRRGEIAALNLETDLDFERGEIIVNKALAEDENNVWVKKPPKTKHSVRRVGAPPSLMERLKQARDEGYRMPSPDYISHSFEEIKKKVGINIRFHDLRHYFASVMLALGVPDLYAMRMMGHSTPNMLKNVYQHIMAEKQAEIQEKVRDDYEKMLQGLQKKEEGGSEDE